MKKSVAIVIQHATYSLAGQAIAMRVTGDPDNANNGLFYLHSDHLGSASVLQHSDGTVVNEARYYPFGEHCSTLGFSSGPNEITDRGFTGHRHNDGLGLIYMNARYYVKGIGRFASADTIVPNPTNPQSLNRYTYVLNSPLNYIDPTGHNPLCSSGGAVCSDGAYDDGATYDPFAWLPPTIIGEWPFESNEDLSSLIGLEFEGGNSTVLQTTMIMLSKHPTGKELDGALGTLAKVRGLDFKDVREQYDYYYALTIRARIIGDQNNKGHIATTKVLEWWGSTEQLRSGGIVGDAFGIDPVFGALLNPTSGRVGAGDSSFVHWSLQNSEAWNYHGQVHDAGGYLYNYHNVGPGYTYLDVDASPSQRGNPFAGQYAGYAFFSSLLDN